MLGFSFERRCVKGIAVESAAYEERSRTWRMKIIDPIFRTCAPIFLADCLNKINHCINFSLSLSRCYWFMPNHLLCIQTMRQKHSNATLFNQILLFIHQYQFVSIQCHTTRDFFCYARWSRMINMRLPSTTAYHVFLNCIFWVFFFVSECCFHIGFIIYMLYALMWCAYID